MKTSKKDRKPDAAEPDMVKYTCQGCGFQGFDVQEYFSSKPSTHCLWCVKYPKSKKQAANASDINGSAAAEKA